MTTFLTKAQRDYLVAEYRDLLDEMGELEEFGGILDEIQTYNNVAFWAFVQENMPIYAEPVGHKILHGIK